MTPVADDRVASSLIQNLPTFTTNEQLQLAREVVAARMVAQAARHWVAGHDDAYRDGHCPCKLCDALRVYDQLQ